MEPEPEEPATVAGEEGEVIGSGRRRISIEGQLGGEKEATAAAEKNAAAGWQRIEQDRKKDRKTRGRRRGLSASSAESRSSRGSSEGGVSEEGLEHIAPARSCCHLAWELADHKLTHAIPSG